MERKFRCELMHSLVLNPELLQRYDVAGPRYTSYPTADRFVEAFGEADYLQALEQRRDGIGSKAYPLSLYVHIPFCESLCYYCACNKIITKHHERGAEYLRYLEREVDLNIAHLGQGQVVSQLHLGGGSPTFLSDAELAQLMAMLRRNFQFAPGGEYSVEIDPRTVTRERVAHLAEQGFNRLSFGVQDFEPAVQKAVHRIQPAEQVFDLVAAARELGFESVNADLIYGLPMQTPETFERTLEKITQLRPDRIALYAYAHLPERFKPQRRIHTQDLPPAASKLVMLSSAMRVLVEAGYVYVGMDHFALPQPDCDLIALGVSSIGRVGLTFSQNVKTLDEYYDLLNQGRLPVARGMALSRDDLVRRTVIMALMCQGSVLFESVELSHLVDFKQYFAPEMEALSAMQEQGLLTIDDTGIHVTELGWFFVRGVAMVFDKYLQADKNRARFSKII
jgi:oxygen-independent coproporphyrinogen III oxidase